MKRQLLVILALLMIASLLAACAAPKPAATTPAPAKVVASPTAAASAASPTAAASAASPTAAAPAAAPTVALKAPVAPTAVPPTSAPAAKALTVDMLRNAAYTLNLGTAQARQVKLADGKFEQNTPPDRLVVSMLPLFATGDLNGDGVDDAAVVIAYNTGGSGTFLDLAAVLNEKGAPKHIASTLLGDRAKIDGMAIAASVIGVEMVTHGPKDPMCCPTLKATASYKLQSGKLVNLAPATPASVTPTAAPKAGEGIANPASANCVALGGTLQIVQRGDGSEYGVCTFGDGRACEEWALFRGECPPGGKKLTGYVTEAARYCVLCGGAYAITANSNTPNEQGTCAFPNGAKCDAWDYFNGKCTATSAAAAAPVVAKSVGAWKTYTDAAWKVTFEYPTLYDTLPQCAFAASPSLQGGLDMSIGTRVGLSVWKDATTTLDSWLVKYLAEFNVESREATTVDKAPAVRVVFRSRGVGRYAELVALKKGDTFYLFDFTVPTLCDFPEAQIDEAGAFKHLLASFRFLP